MMAPNQWESSPATPAPANPPGRDSDTDGEPQVPDEGSSDKDDEPKVGGLSSPPQG